MPIDPCAGPVLDPNCPFLAGVPDFKDYRTPFPSNTGQSAKVSALLEKISYTGGNYAALQASSWQQVVRMGMKSIAGSAVAGGLRTDLMPVLVGSKQTQTGALLTGIFAEVSFPATTNKAAMVDAAVNTGFAVAATAVNAVPVVGQILSAAIAIGAWLYNLFRSKSRDEAELVIPWQEWEAQSDEDLVQILGDILQSGDWTPIWEPPFEIGPGFQLAKTDKGGDTRGYGAFAGNGRAIYTAIGVMPGTQRVAEVVQLAQVSGSSTVGAGDRIDAVTNIADFSPSTSQFATFAWQMVMRMGGAWMYMVKPGELSAAWASYWDAYFGEGLERLGKLGSGTIDALYLAKALGKFLTFKDVGWHIGLPDPFLERSGNLYAFIDDSIWSAGNKLHPGTRYYTPYKLIHGTLESLRARQLAALSKTVVSAYVRPDEVAGMAPHAAFLDSSPATDPAFATWGEQLAAECRKVREILLVHDARCSVRMADAKVADPAFAERLKDSNPGITCVSKLKADLLPSVARTPRPLPPQGGAPYEPTGGNGGRRRSNTGLKVAAGAVAVAGGAYAGRRFGWW